ncbi:hypothetical protein [Vagococcus fluvialis]|uniref:hypothetical protein n=1 Tax=Vagococcus fluvialis TaxID=2738 RepID=UPI002B2D3D6F|nr:hypothetical protein QDW48_04735 [Vagococcus fluvialis]
MATFINELFNLVKYFEKIELKKEIVLRRQEMSQKNADKFINKSLYFSGSKEERNHFYGMLLINSDLERGLINDNLFKQLETLTIEEKTVFLNGHQLILDIFNNMRSQLEFLPLQYQLVLSPYSNLKKLEIEMCSTERIDLSQHSFFFDSFGKMPLVRKLERKYKEISKLIQKVEFQELNMMLDSIDREISEYGFKNCPATLRDISIKRLDNNLKDEEKVFDFFYSLFFLKESIRLTINTIYSVLIGNELPVINEENIIKIGSEFSDGLKNGVEYLLINNETTPYNVGNLVLMSYEIKKYNEKVHDFGLIYKISRKLGDDGTTKCSILKVDECLNCYSNFDKA